MEQEHEKLWQSELCENAVIDYKKTPLRFHTVDRSLLRVANKTFAKGKKIVINYPLHRCDLLAPLMLEACFVNIEKKRRKNLLITNKILVRDFYDSLMQAGGKVSHQLFPIGMVSRNGRIKPIYETIIGLQKKYKEFIRDSTVLLSSSLKYLPEDTTEIGAVVFDLDQSYDEEAIDYLLRWTESSSITSVIFVISESETENIRHFSQLGIPVWGWTPAMLKKEFEDEKLPQEGFDAPFYRSAEEVYRLAHGIKRYSVLVEPPQRFHDLLSNAYNFYKDCWRVLRQKEIPLLKEALLTHSKALKNIERLTAPLTFVEEEEEGSWGVLSLQKRLDKLKMLQEKIESSDPIAAGLAANAASNIEKLRDWLFENRNPKHEKILSIISESNSSACFLFFRACDKYATLAAISKETGADEKSLNRRGFHFATHSELDLLAEDFKTLYVPGAVPSYARFLLRAAQAEKTVFLLYPTELALLAKEIEEDNNAWNTEFSVEARAYAVSSLLDANLSRIQLRIRAEYATASPPESQECVVKDLEKSAQNEKIGSESASSFFSNMAPADPFGGALGEDINEQDDDSSIDYASQDTVLSEEGIEVRAVKIDFDNSQSIAVPESKRLPIFLEFKEKVIYKEASRISKGDIVVIINKGTKDTLAQSIFNILHKLPSMRNTVLYARSWALLLKREIMKNVDTPAIVLGKLQEEGSSITNQLTIVHWLLGEAIGPRDKKDILRIARIYNIKVLEENYRKISEAVTALRGIHHTLVRRLSLLMPTAGLKAMRSDSSDDDLISPELGLHVEDFYSAITLKKTQAFTKVNADYKVLNKLMDTSQLEHLEGREQ